MIRLKIPYSPSNKLFFFMSSSFLILCFPICVLATDYFARADTQEPLWLRFGCIKKSDWESIFNQSWGKDQRVYIKSLKKTVAQKKCVIFDKGERLIIEDIEYDLVQVRRKGSSQKYWSNAIPEFLGKPLSEGYKFWEELERKKAKGK